MVDYTCDSTFGLILKLNHTTGFGIFGLVQLLSLPRRFRRANLFGSRLIKTIYYNQIKTAPMA